MKMSVNRNAPLFLSDGTPVAFVKVTSRGRYQVRLPDSHPFAAGQDNGRIFDPTSGRHYKNQTALTLTNTAPAAAATVASAPARGRVDHNAPLFLSDGTAVTFVKITRRGNIQVRLPDNHPNAAGQENGLLFASATGTRYKDRDPKDLFLTNTAPAVGAAPVATATDYATSVNGTITEDGFTSYDAAQASAIGQLSGDVTSVQIVAVETKVVGVVGLSLTRA